MPGRSVCIVYDCLYPHTVGGGERWYRGVAERLAADGHQVTYLTLRQWDRGVDPGVPGVDVRAVGPRMALYGPRGTRRILPPLVFGFGVLLHLLRHGRIYDVVHSSSFPFFSLLAAAAVRPLGRFALVVDWFEVWTLAYWRDYLGRAAGTVGWLVQRACARVRQQAFCFSRLHAQRLTHEGLRSKPITLDGLFAGAAGQGGAEPGTSTVVFAGRHIPEKRVPALVPAIERVRRSTPEVDCDIYGDGPDRERVQALVSELGLDGLVRVHGFVDSEVVREGLAHALCMVLPSRREGYGLVVVEAAATGTPSVVVADPDNAATELIEAGVNGFVAASASPEDLAAAIVRVHRAGAGLRESTADWFARNRERLSLDRSLARVVAAYNAPPAGRS